MAPLNELRLDFRNVLFRLFYRVRCVYDALSKKNAFDVESFRDARIVG